MKRLAFLALGLAAALAGALAPGCQCGALCGPANCSGCCGGDGQCRPGGTSAACGSHGGICISCSASEVCSAGACLPPGLSGTDGGACNASNCPNGCCAPNGVCISPANTVVACGQGGSACAICQTGESCTAGQCVSGTCNGCLSGEQCLAGDGDGACGSGGAVCQACTGSNHCNAGQCVPTCSGCLDATNTCQTGTSNANCGTAGGRCQACTGTAQCSAGQCVTPGCNGCVNGSGCQPGTSTAACGAGGTACQVCPPGDSCTSGTCVNTTPFDGGLSCTTPKTFPSCGGCGTERWSVKTVTDPAGSMINQSPQLTTIAQLLQQPTQSNGSAPRGGGSGTWLPEYNTYLLRNVTVQAIKSESDGDYHVVIKDPTTGGTMVAEVPCPSCATGSLFYCNITHARASLAANMSATQASLIGVGFYDPPHGQTGAAPNNLEIHPVVAICFTQDCDPTAN